MIPLSLDSLYEYLTTQKVDVKRQPETKQLYVLNKIHDTEYPTFIRVMDEGELLQILAFMPVSLDPKTVPDLSRLLHLFNKEIDIPGFGMDEASKVCFYRIVLPGLENQISGEIVTGYMNSIHVIIETFFPVIAAVVTGAANYEDILKKANQTIKP
jgi:hypothetical protein